MGVVSTEDPENYVPQNVKYNSPIRRDLEEELRRKNLSYKEITIYHNDPYYNVYETSEKNVKKTSEKTARIPVPEGFLFFVFHPEKGDVKDCYYFPNLVDYEVLKGEQPTYKHFPKEYRVEDLKEWFVSPRSKRGKPSRTK